MFKNIAVILVSLIILSACKSNDATKKNYSTKAADFLTGKNVTPTLDLVRDQDLANLPQYWIAKNNKAASHPMSPETNNKSGCVELTFIVDREAKEIKVTKSYPQGAFDQEALKTIKTWSWRPTSKNNIKIPAMTRVQMNFISETADNQDEASQECGLTAA